MKTVLETGVAHPQIHTDYYGWLGNVQKDDFNKKFIEEHSKSFEDFHAIAMWVWSQSRETLAQKAKSEG